MRLEGGGELEGEGELREVGMEGEGKGVRGGEGRREGKGLRGGEEGRKSVGGEVARDLVVPCR